MDTRRQSGIPTGRYAAIEALAPRLDHPIVERAGDALITSLEKPEVPRKLNDLAAYGLAMLAEAGTGSSRASLDGSGCKLG